MTLKEATARISDSGISEAGQLCRIAFREIGGLRDFELLSAEARCDSPALLSAIERLSHGEPIDYILGYRDFYRERNKVTPDVLIPRSDTEMLVDYAVKNIPEGEAVEKLIELIKANGDWKE